MATAITPAGYRPPFAPVSIDDHTAWILIATSLGIVYVVIFGGMRAFVRYSVGRGLGPEDVALVASTVLGIIQSSIILVCCAHGLGKAVQNISPRMQELVQRMYYASNLLFIASLGTAKISVFLFLQQLTASSTHKRIFKGFVATVVVWIVGSLFALAFQCELPRTWLLIGQKCPGVSTLKLERWQVICAFDILFEVAIVWAASLMVWTVHMPISKKVTVVSTFVFRLLLIVPIGFRLATFNASGLTTNPTLLEDSFIIWTQVELSYSLISATIPVLRPVINNFVTHYGALGPAESAAYGSGKGSATAKSGDSHRVSNFKGLPKIRTITEEAPIELESIKHNSKRPYSWGIAVANADHIKSPGGSREVNAEQTSVESNDSQQMIIKKQLSWRVDVEEGENGI